MARTRLLVCLLAAGLVAWTGTPPAGAVQPAGTGSATGTANLSSAYDPSGPWAGSFSFDGDGFLNVVVDTGGAYSGPVAIHGGGSLSGFPVRTGDIWLTLHGESPAVRSSAEGGPLLRFVATCGGTTSTGTLNGVVVVGAGVTVSVRCVATVSTPFGQDVTFAMCLRAAGAAVAVTFPITSFAVVAGLVVYPCP